MRDQCLMKVIVLVPPSRCLSPVSVSEAHQSSFSVYARLLKHMYRGLAGPAYDGEEAQTAKQKSKNRGLLSMKNPLQEYRSKKVGRPGHN
jgi:hypothetical protein